MRSRAELEQKFGKPIEVYVESMRKKGKKDQEIRMTLMKVGWDKESIDYILKRI